MSKGLEELKELKQSCETHMGRLVYILQEDRFETLEKELKEYQEIREIAKRYNWDDITSEIFNVETDKKYHDLFNSAIVNIQEDYRKARAFDIINNNHLIEGFISSLCETKNYDDYKNTYITNLTEEEYNLLRDVLL